MFSFVSAYMKNVSVAQAEGVLIPVRRIWLFLGNWVPRTSIQLLGVQFFGRMFVNGS